MKNSNINTYVTNLIGSEEFRAALQFEADHAIKARGGQLPDYLNSTIRRRLVDPINLLNTIEKHNVIHRIFTSKN